ncbi:MAG TPA: STAS domain-containing protein [Pirellulales bacterium]|jgi:anti-sigma B factor antagonist
MNLPTEVFGNVVVIHSPEELGADHAEPFEHYLTHQERRNVVLDLDNSESITSDGLAALLNVQDKLRAEAGDLKIATANAVNRKILEITRLDQHLEVFDSVIDAVTAFR